MSETHGLQVEVINSFGEYRASGDDVIKAVNSALYDWDIA